MKTPQSSTHHDLTLVPEPKQRGHRMSQASTTKSTTNADKEIAMTTENKNLPDDPFAKHDVDPPVSELRASDFFPPGEGWNQVKPPIIELGPAPPIG
jgi:hypothetical protein